MPKIEIPKLNPEMLYNLKQTTSDKYLTKPFMTTLWQESLLYYQKFNKFRDNSSPQYYRLKNLSGYIALQIASPAWDTFEFKVIGSDGTEYDAPFPIADTRTIIGELNEDGEQLIRIKIYLKLDDLITDEGYYCWYIKINYLDGTSEELISDPVWVLEHHENVLNIEYWNDANDYDIWWEMTPNFSILMPANIEFSHEEVKKIVFRNQKANLRLLHAQNWQVFDAQFGFPEGLSSYDQSKLYNIFKCDNVYIDNVRYLQEEGAEFEKEDFGKAYPLRNLKTQLVLYDQKDSITVGGAGSLYIMDLGELRGFPYAITRFYLNAGTSGLFNYLTNFTNEIAEILDTTMQDDAITQWNADAVAYGRTGEFEKIDNKLYYKRGEGETDTTNAAFLHVLDTCLQVWFESDPSDETLDVTVTQNATVGKTVISVWRDSSGTGGTFNMIAPDYIPLLGGDIFAETYQPSAAPDYDGWRMYMYSNNYATKIELSNVGDNIVTLTGEVSTNLEEFVAVGGQLNVFDSAFLRSAASKLIRLSLQNMGISSIDSGCFTRVGANDWKYFNEIDFAENDLDDAGQDDFFNNFYTDIASYWLAAYGGAGTLSTVLQTTFSAPTVASSTSRTNLITIGYTVAT